MRFEYIDYDKMIIDDIERDSETIYIFSDFTLKNSMKKSVKKNIFNREPLYLIYDEFKDMIYRTDKVILTDIKRFTTLYDNLKKEFLSLNINSYFESVEFAKLFFEFFTELNRAMISEKLIVEKWQESYIDMFYSFKSKYDKFLKKTNSIPSDWIENIDNFDISLIKNYKKIVFVDIVNFSKLDKEVIDRLKESFEICFRVQGEMGFFDEESLEIREVNIPKLQKSRFEIIEVKDEIEMIDCILTLQESVGGGVNIFSPESETNEYYKIFPNNFIKSGFYTLNETDFFKFLSAQYEVIKGIDSRFKGYILIENFLEFINIDIVKRYYELESSDIDYIYEMIADGYRYVGDEKNETINLVLKDIERVSKFKTVEEYIEYFNILLENPKMYENRFEDFYEKIQEYMGYALTTRQLLSKGCLKNKGDILRFILQYLNNVELKKIEDNENKYLIKPLSMVKSIRSREAFFINLSNIYLPKKNRQSFFMSEQQRKRYGLISLEKQREIEKYRFYQAILKNNKNTIIYIKNDITGERETPFLSEIMENYEVEKSNYTAHSENILTSILYTSEKREIIKKDTTLIKCNKDFEDEIKIGAYQFEALKNCFYRYYLQYIIGLERKEIEEIEPLSIKFLGIYIHNIYERLTDMMWKKILNKRDYSIDEEFLDELLEKEFKRNRKKVLSSLELYFCNILIPRFKRNILKFFKRLEECYSEKKVTRVESEKSTKNNSFIESGEKVIKLNGRVDLIVETDESKQIFDFKTGGKSDLQLDFYSIMLYGSEVGTAKTVYNAFEGEFKEQDKINLTREDLRESLIEFLEASSYKMAEKSSNCGYCQYFNICRKEF